MISKYLLYTIPQWAIFSGITVIIYGYVEKKEVFERIGLAILVLLGLFAAYVLASGSLLPEKFLTPEEYALPEEYISEEDIPVEGKLIPAFWGMVAAGILALVALVFKTGRIKHARLMMVLAAFVAIMMFFLTVNVVTK